MLKIFMNESAIDETVFDRYLPHPDLPNMGPLIVVADSSAPPTCCRGRSHILNRIH